MLDPRTVPYRSRRDYGGTSGTFAYASLDNR